MPSRALWVGTALAVCSAQSARALFITEQRSMIKLFSVLVPLLFITGCSRFQPFTEQDCTNVVGQDRIAFNTTLSGCEQLVSQSDRRQCRIATIRSYCRVFVYVLDTDTGEIQALEKGIPSGSNDFEKRHETRD